MEGPTIALNALTRDYGDFRAVDSVDLEVRPGEIFGFLGPNGSGKTTTIRILMGLLAASSGSARILGMDCMADRVEIKRHVGYLPDHPVYYRYIRGHEVLSFVGGMHGLEEAMIVERGASLLKRLRLDDAAGEYAMNYSMGMKKKLALACALIHQPKLLILDEPTAGLDPNATREIRGIVKEVATGGNTVFLSTHLLDMASRLCDRVGIIYRGKIVAMGTPDELQAALGEGGTLEDVFVALTDDDAVEGPSID